MKLAFDLYVPDIQKVNSNSIVLLHSILETRKTWKSIAQPLAELTGRKVYSCDARHHGDSPWSGGYSIDILVGDLYEFLGNHSIEKVILVGHSVGGKVAISFTLKHPERVESMIVEDVPVRNFKHRLHNLVPFAVKMTKQLSADFREITDRDKADQHIRQLGHRFADFLVVSPETVEGYDFECLPIKWNGSFYQLDVNIEAVTGAVRHNTLQSQCPVSGQFIGDALFIIGGASQIKADQDAMIVKCFPKAVKVIFNEAGHFIHQSFPKEFVTEVANFINKNDGKKAKL